ncbi:MAG: hypothetical protein Q7J85_08710 [Bacillota bacterium]|nr:hypothetical protein [Bacillota bacterium]
MPLRVTRRPVAAFIWYSRCDIRGARSHLGRHARPAVLPLGHGYGMEKPLELLVLESGRLLQEI